MRVICSSFPGRGVRRKSGAALILTLATIVLLTAVIIAFFSFSTLNLKNEERRANGKQAAVLAYSGAIYATTLFLQELATNSTYDLGSPGLVTNYFPTAATGMIPARILPATISSSDPNYYNLIRQSAPHIDPNASGDSTALPAANGRTITVDRWNRSSLIAGSTGMTSAQFPNWIYVDRLLGPTSTPGANTIGRFAFNVYDIGGLLDANAAGFPASLTAQQASQLKGTPAGADLTQLPGLSQADVAALLAFRNSSTVGNATNYISAVQGAERNGFLSPAYTNTSPDVSESQYYNNYFASRQDLVRYAQTQNQDLTNALPYLTTFSRNVTAPSWIPWNPTNTAGATIKSSYSYSASALSSGTTNRAVIDVRLPSVTAVPHYRDDGTLETPTPTVAAGEPFVQRRFSLAKLAWITTSGPAANIPAAAILDRFGLTWNSSNEQWTYQDATIKTLDQVAALNPPREPNFFEMLKAAILAGSVGSSSANKTADNAATTPTPKQAYEANSDLQIMRIGASIIDCAKSDNFPTNIVINGVPVHGVQDLPYLYGFLNTPLLSSTTTGTTNKLNWGTVFFVPLLFNPHLAPVSPLPASSTPAQLRVVVGSGTLNNIYLSSADDAGGLGPVSTPGDLYQSPNYNLANTTVPIQLPLTSSLFRAGVGPVVNATSPTTLSTFAPHANTSDSSAISGFQIYSYTAANQTYSTPGCLRIHLENFLMELQYYSPKRNWITYDTVMGNEINSGSGIGGATSVSMDNYPGEPFSTRTSVLTGSSANMKFDPRTCRYGLPYIYQDNITLSSSSPYTVNPALSSGGMGMTTHLPFGSGNISAPGIYPGLWAQGSTTGWSDVSTTLNVADSGDGLVRPADGSLGASGTTPGPANLFTNMASTSNLARPVILHRPYQSVAELGYVFRDTPWKSLNFSDSSSGDVALLDFFSVVDEPAISSGRVSLNTRQPLVLQALLSGAALDATGTVATTLPSPSSIASALVGASSSFGVDANGNAQTTLPVNVAQLPSFMSSPALTNSYVPTAGSPDTCIEYEREAIVRALAGSCQSRTWNLLIDVIAQGGKFPVTSSSGGSFLIQGEKHYWLSVAIDRFTGKIVDQQLEAVDE